MKERAVKEWPETVTIWRRRDNALGFMPEMTPEEKARYGTENFAFKDYVPQQRVNALVEALEFYADYERNYLDDQPGEPVGLDRDPESGMWEMDDYAPDQGKRARTALANYKEGEA